MTEENFLYKTFFEFIITSDNISPSEISNRLNIIPHRQFAKGDLLVSPNGQHRGKRSHNLWSVRSESIISIDEDINPHIQSLQAILEGKEIHLREFKKSNEVVLTLWVWIETDNAGIGFEINENFLSYIHEITNGIRVSLITNIKIESPI